MKAAAFEGGGYVLLEFEAGFNSDVALQDIRAKVDDAKAELPADADEPRVHEVNLSLLPVVLVSLAGDMSERTLNQIAHQAQDAIELVPGVLSADIKGLRDEVVEIIAEPMLLESYGVSLDEFAVAAARRQQPRRRRRARRAAGAVRRQGAGADRDAGGRAQHPGRRLQRRRRDPRRRRQGAADLQGRRPRSPGSTGSRPSSIEVFQARRAPT